MHTHIYRHYDYSVVSISSRPVFHKMFYLEAFALVLAFFFCELKFANTEVLLPTFSNNEEKEEPDYENMEYGGVWKKIVTKISIYDEDINSAYRFVVKYLDEIGHIKLMEQNGVILYRVSNVTKKIVQYTSNGYSPLYIQINIPCGNVLTPLTVPVDFGSIMTFKIDWRTLTFHQHHHITVTEFLRLNFYVYSHTFYRVYYNPIDKPSICLQIVNGYKHEILKTNNQSLTSQQILESGQLASGDNIKKKFQKVKIKKLDLLKDRVNTVNPFMYQTPDQIRVHYPTKKKSDKKQSIHTHEKIILDNDMSRVTIKMRKIQPKQAACEKEKENKVFEENIKQQDIQTHEKSESKLKNFPEDEKPMLTDTSIKNDENMKMHQDLGTDCVDSSIVFDSPVKESSSNINADILKPLSSKSSSDKNTDKNSPDVVGTTEATEVLHYHDTDGTEFEVVVYDDVMQIRILSDSNMRTHLLSNEPIELVLPSNVNKSQGKYKTWKYFVESLWICERVDTNYIGFGCCNISVLSYNIWFFNPKTDNDTDYIQRIHRAGKILSGADVDVIGLQEVRFQEGKGGVLGSNQIDYFSSILPEYQFVYQPAMLMSESLSLGKTEEGLAILSRYEIISHDYILLYRNMSNSADRHQRICLHAVINIPGVGNVHVFNTHLSLSHEARQESIQQIWEYMGKFEGPIILLGDFNAEPNEQAIKNLKEKYNIVDIWTYIHGNTNTGNTFSALDEKRHKRIDYIFHIKQGNTEILNITLLDTESFGDLAASDHLAVLSTLGFNCPQRQ